MSAGQRAWRPDEDAILLEMRQAGQPMHAIAARLGRTTKSVEHRIYKSMAPARRAMTPIDTAGQQIARRLGVSAERPTVSPRAANSGTLDPVLIVPDLHAPYHSALGWDLLMQVARDLRPTWLYAIGDFADFYSVSAHDKNPERAHRLSSELDVVDGLLDELDALGAAHKVYIEGNHEDRLKRYLMKSPELHGVVSTEKLLRLRERGWAFVPYKEHTRLGAVHLTHDVGAAGRNAVFRALDLYQHSVVTGHTHRFQYIVEGTAADEGECKVSAMFGWLGDVEQMDYMTKAKARHDWALGFGVGYYDPSTEYVYLVPVPVVRSTCMVNGKLYRATARAA